MREELLEVIDSITVDSVRDRLSGVLKLFREAIQIESVAILIISEQTPTLIYQEGYPQEVLTLFSEIRFYTLLNQLSYSQQIKPVVFPTWESIGWGSTDFARDVMRPAGFRDGSSLPILTASNAVAGYLHFNMAKKDSAVQFSDHCMRLRNQIAALATLVQGQLNCPLTQREREVLRLVERGYTSKQIGDDLFLSSRTVSTHIDSILKKTGTANRTQAAMWAWKHQI